MHSGIFRFRLRSLLLAVGLLAVSVVVAMKVLAAYEQQQCVARLDAVGAVVEYELSPGWTVEFNADPSKQRTRFIPLDFFYPVVSVDFAYLDVDDQELLSLASLTSITALDLTDADITDVGLRIACQLPRLEKLNLDGCGRLTNKELVRQLTKCGQLTSLTLERASPQIIAAIAALPRLEELRIRSALSIEGGRVLARLQGLRILEINGAEFEDTHVAELLALRTLKELYLSRTGITDAGVRRLEVLVGLQLFVCVDTKVTDDGLNRLKDAIPNCETFAGYDIVEFDETDSVE